MALNKEKKAQIIKEFARDGKDTGSPEVQIAILTKEITALTEHLKNNNCNIYIITGRNKNKRKITESWLEKNNICYESIVFGDKYKLETCKNLKIDYFFDDSSKVVNLLNENGIKAYLIDEIERLYYG